MLKLRDFLFRVHQTSKFSPPSFGKKKRKEEEDSRRKKEKALQFHVMVWQQNDNMPHKTIIVLKAAKQNHW